MSKKQKLYPFPTGPRPKEGFEMKDYETMEVNLDQDTEFKLAELYVKRFTKESQSVFSDGVTDGQDFRIAFYDAWRNEEIIKALTEFVNKNSDSPPVPEWPDPRDGGSW